MPPTDGDPWVDLTAHASTRWRQRRRRTDPLVGPRVAWFEGVRLPSTHGLDADEVRYHEPTDTLLLRHEDRLVTVIAREFATEAAKQATDLAQQQARIEDRVAEAEAVATDGGPR